jgi:hypothetical protein
MMLLVKKPIFVYTCYSKINRRLHLQEATHGELFAVLLFSNFFSLHWPEKPENSQTDWIARMTGKLEWPKSQNGNPELSESRNDCVDPCVNKYEYAMRTKFAEQIFKQLRCFGFIFRFASHHLFIKNIRYPNILAQL